MSVPNIPLLPKVMQGPHPADQPSLEIASEGVQRYVWNSAYGAVLIEANGEDVWVNGQRVVPAGEVQGGKQQVDETTTSHIMR
jgi:hypothetical protein